MNGGVWVVKCGWVWVVRCGWVWVMSEVRVVRSGRLSCLKVCFVCTVVCVYVCVISAVLNYTLCRGHRQSSIIDKKTAHKIRFYKL